MKDIVILITGAAKGMGEAAVRRFAAEGASVVAADLDLTAATALADELNAKGYKVTAVQCDVSKADQVKTTVEKAVALHGRLDAAFNNAGIQIPNTYTADLSEEDYDKVLDVNLKGVWLCMKYELIEMRKQGSGTIVNNSSIGGLVGAPGRVAYHAAKHGILGLTKSAAAEYAAEGIRINAVCPGTIDTPMVRHMIDTGDLSEKETINNAPIKRLGKAEEIADAVYWLSSPQSSFVIGQAITVDGGLTIL